MNTYNFECFKCSHRYINYLRCFECEKCESAHLGAVCTICNEKVFNDEAALAEHDKKHINMKEFDLRPFEVKKELYYPYVIKAVLVNGDIVSFTSDKFESIEAAEAQITHLKEVHKIFFKMRAFQDRDEKPWQWEDIQVGWFFKCSDGYLYWKHEDGEFRPLGEKCRMGLKDTEIEFSHFFVLGTNYDPDSDLVDKSITNVYDCPELAKMLMIERIIT